MALPNLYLTLGRRPLCTPTCGHIAPTLSWGLQAPGAAAIVSTRRQGDYRVCVCVCVCLCVQPFERLASSCRSGCLGFIVVVIAVDRLGSRRRSSNGLASARSRSTPATPLCLQRHRSPRPGRVVRASWVGVEVAVGKQSHGAGEHSVWSCAGNGCTRTS